MMHARREKGNRTSFSIMKYPLHLRRSILSVRVARRMRGKKGNADHLFMEMRDPFERETERERKSVES